VCQSFRARRAAGHPPAHRAAHEEEIMRSPIARALHRPLAVVAATVLLAACGDDIAVAPEQDGDIAAQFAKQPPQREINLIVAQLRRVTDRYHNLTNAIADGFVLVHDCEVRPGEGTVGTVYAHPGRMGDGQIRPGLPDALLYEPSSTGRPKLVGVELVMPYALWTQQTPPTFLGQTFWPEDEFGIFGLHVWVWRHNPDGLFAPGNPNVSCDA
jgi:hypothetical protein